VYSGKNTKHGVVPPELPEWLGS